MSKSRDLGISADKVTIFVFWFMFSISTILQASEKEQQVVLELYPQWYSDENYTIQGNIGIEKVFDSSEWVKYYTKPSFVYALDNNWALHAGLGLYYTDHQDNNNDLEIRPFQGISHFSPLTEKWKLSSYLRVEERFKYDTSTWDKENTVRLRFRLRTDYTLNPLSKENSWHKFLFSIEGFKTYNQETDPAQDPNDYESIVTFGAERSLREQNKVRFELAWKYKSLPIHISESSVNTFYFKIQYYPIWGEILRNKLFDRGIDD